MSIEDKRALAVMMRSSSIVDGHYQIALPWKEPNTHLPNDLCLVGRKLSLLKKRFLRDSNLFEGYKATMESYLNKGHARRVPDDDLNTEERPLWYLPHHPV